VVNRIFTGAKENFAQFFDQPSGAKAMVLKEDYDIK